MGLRSRIKGRIKSVLGGAGTHTASDGSAPSAASTASPTAAAGAMPSTSATPLAASPAAASPAAASPAAASPAAAEEAARQAKIVRHRLKTKAGVLKWLGEQEGGRASMSDMHDYSERRFFVAHKGFSDLMEQLTGEGLIDFDPDGGQCTITASGRDWKA